MKNERLKELCSASFGGMFLEVREWRVGRAEVLLLEVYWKELCKSNVFSCSLVSAARPLGASTKSGFSVRSSTAQHSYFTISSRQ
jgi:hypothetical protein